ncbi:hypothetical protein EXIGLDRAFT_623077 [Exidia glandulosa HHB12029]|uniref:Polysaccharide lyase 14 domain-containing protein n=1 Tax=Exidia glandulosa HHB12029 TaxID=1314781 RepID=A0A165DV34_EXIGL|nr:hypothetical protein EXIGLDRAFT_623077 [Exidia glandulosa HHB12029]
MFPLPVTSAWSTLPAAPGVNGVDLVKLDNTVLGVTKILHDLDFSVVTAPGSAPNGTSAWLATYPKGSYNPTGEPRGGIGFYFPGPAGHDWSDASTTQIMFSYAVYFPTGFQFVKGGKLPGPYGGASADEAFACSGGRQEDRAGCFDLRLMWRTAGAGEIYAYVPETDDNTAALSELQNTVIDDSFGVSVARGSFKFATGDWTAVAQRVKLNTVGQKDGELELFVNGKSVLQATGLEIRTSAASVFRGVHFQSFFGGSDNSWATPIDQQVHFAGMSGAVLAAGASPNEGKAAFPLGDSSTVTRTPTGSSDLPTGTGTTSGGDSDSDGTGAAGALRVSGALVAVVAAVAAAFI